jgi:hypothetical protein
MREYRIVETELGKFRIQYQRIAVCPDYQMFTGFSLDFEWAFCEWSFDTIEEAMGQLKKLQDDNLNHKVKTVIDDKAGN